MSWSELIELYKEYVKECLKINLIAFFAEFTVETIIDLIKAYK